MGELKLSKDFIKKKALQEEDRAFINLRPLLGNFNWAEFLFLIGGAQAGKSYAITDFFVNQFINKGTTFTWLRLKENQCKKLLQNNAEKLVDPDIRRRYNLDLVTSGTNVYHVTKRSEPDKNGKTKILEKKLMARVLALSTFYGDKGSGLYDKTYDGWYNIGIDEMQPEKGEKRTFDVVYAFVRQMENLVRNSKCKVRVIGACNLLEEASDILCCFNFIPEEFGTYKIKSKRCVINYIKPTKAYKEMRKGSIADMLLPNASMYSNRMDNDYSLIDKRQLLTPNYVIKFGKDRDKWFTVWNNNIIAKYNGEHKPVIPMKPYLDEAYNRDMVKQVIDEFDTRCYHFRNYITFKQFQSQLELLRPTK